MSPAGGGRPLSSVPRPLSGAEGPEAFGSFVERVAARQLEPTSVWTILVETGLLPEDRFNAPMPVAYGIDLTPEQREAFIHVCKLEPGELGGLLLRSLDGAAFDLSGLDLADGDSVRAVGVREWAGFAGSACCPACLGETGGWRLRWRLWTSFVCLTHGRLLIDRCPGCDQRTAVFRRGQGTRPLFATHMPQPGHCGNGVPHGRRTAEKAGWPCGHDLRLVPSPDLSGTPRLLVTQRAVNAVLDQQGRGRGPVVAGQAVSALTYFHHLRSLVALALHAAQPADLGELPPLIALALHEVCERRDAERLRTAGVRGTRDHPYKAAPDDTRLVAATLPWATELLASPDQAGITAGLRPLIKRSQEIRGSAVRSLGRDFHLEGPLAAGLDEALASRAKFQRGLGHLAPAGTGKYRTFSPSLVPHLIWQEDYERDFLPLLEGSNIGETAARVAISLALVRLTGPHALPTSVTLLGLDGLSKGASSNPMVGHLGRTGGRAAFGTALHALATRLEGPGPHRDYRAAQSALEGLVDLDRGHWEACCEAAGVSWSSDAQRRNGAAWIWAQVLSSDPHFSPALTHPARQQESVREVYRRFRAWHLPALMGPLTAYQQQLEDQLGLT